MPTAAQTDIEVVSTFLDALAVEDLETALGLITDDVVWLNTGLPTFQGRRVHAMLRDMVARGVGFSVEMKHIAATGDGVVLTDRFDVLTWRRARTRFWVCGTFTVREGRIAVWDDHYSTTNLLKGLVLGTARSLRRG